MMSYCTNTNENQIALRLLVGYENSSLLGFLMKSTFFPKAKLSAQKLIDIFLCFPYF